MSKINKCINCEIEETSVPLVSLTFAQTPNWICTQCLPTLIHNPGKLEAKFKNMNIVDPVKPKL